jgi:hypothetical protein
MILPLNDRATIAGCQHEIGKKILGVVSTLGQSGNNFLINMVGHLSRFSKNNKGKIETGFFSLNLTRLFQSNASV